MRKNGNEFELLDFFRDLFVHIELKTSNAMKKEENTIERGDKNIIEDRVMLTTVINEAWGEDFGMGIFLNLERLLQSGWNVCPPHQFSTSNSPMPLEPSRWATD